MSKSRLAGFTSRVLMSAAAGLLVLSYLSVVVNPAKAWILVVFGLLFVPLAILNLVLLIWAIKRRSKAFLIPLLALLPSLFFVGRYVQMSDGSGEDVAENRMRIVSYNVGRFALGDMDSRKECRDSIVAFLKGKDADIICLQEFRADDPASVKSYLSKIFKGYNSAYYLYTQKRGCYGNVTLTRFPIKDKGKLIFDNSTNLAIYTDIVAGGSTLRIYNCHFESYNISLSRLVKSMGRDSELLKETEVKMKNSISRRPKQVDQVFRHIAESPVESIVCGDFNDSPMSYTYYKMSQGREDSFIRAGKGFGATYSGLWPLLRIDYVLYPERLRAVGHCSPKVRFSDHYPVVADIVI